MVIQAVYDYEGGRKDMDKVRYLTVEQFARREGKTKQAVYQFLAKARIDGAVRVPVGEQYMWAIPETVKWPDRKPRPSEMDITDLVMQKLARKKPGPKPKE